MKHSYDVIIIGSGIAGLTTALYLPSNLSVAILSKTDLLSGSTRWAQGGIAVALNALDSPEKHIQDTLEAGAGLCDVVAVEVLVREGVARVEDLLRWGMLFDTDQGTLAFTREAAHSIKRVIHAGGDDTGRHVSQFLLELIQDRGNRELIAYADVLECVQEETGFTVDVAYQSSLISLQSSAVIIATGGAGQVYSHTTNPVESTGDGIRLACSLGITMQGMEFYQFHPTALITPEIGTTPNYSRQFLISESVRGEGGILLNQRGERFMKQYDPRMELAPRDIVARAIWQEMNHSNCSCVTLSIAHLDPTFIHTRFPSITQACADIGIHIPADAIPVAPSAHYQIGGIPTNLFGETEMPGVFAVGEVASTGVHGANRLASNSLLEGLVFGKRAADTIAGQSFSIQQKQDNTSEQPIGDLAISQRNKILQLQQEIKQIAWNNLGIVRTHTGLHKALEQLHALDIQVEHQFPDKHPKIADLKSMLATSLEICKASLARKSSVGAHWIE